MTINIGDYVRVNVDISRGGKEHVRGDKGYVTPGPGEHLNVNGCWYLPEDLILIPEQTGVDAAREALVAAYEAYLLAGVNRDMEAFLAALLDDEESA